LLALVAGCLQACGQTCDGGILQANGNAYAYRVGGTVVTYSQAYATGSDAEYTTTTVTLTSTFNGQTIGNSPSSSATPNEYFARATQNSAVSEIGYGTYQAQGYVTLFDSCTGRTYPPYDTGGPYTNVSSLTVVQPVASFLSSSAEPSGIFANQYPQYNQNGSVPTYATTGALGSNTQGAAGTPVWTLTGHTEAVTTTCTTCAYVTVATNENAAAVARCGSGISAYFTVDGLTSTTTNFMILSVIQVDDVGPKNLHVDHQTITGGYQSLWYFLIQDNCGVPMQYVAMHETFPNSFHYELQGANWPFVQVTPPWWTFSSGGWVDTIGYHDTSCGSKPMPLKPQPQLNPTAIYSGLQQIYVDPVLVKTNTQVHYLDHGGYK
jgi:hypothetical protein